MQPIPAVPAQNAAGASIAGFAWTGREKFELENVIDIARAILACVLNLIFDIMLLPIFWIEKRFVFHA
ncbi:MAG: hypothetical protein ACFKPT_15445 [Gloeotrichia echinulata GP01]|jgi:hypothetical protein